MRPLNKTKLLVSLLFAAAIQSGCTTVSKMLAQGGTEFTIAVETVEQDKSAILAQALTVTENRINAAGLRGEVIKGRDASDRFTVRIYGDEDLERIRKFLFTSYQLELRKVISPPNPAPVQVYPTSDAARLAAMADHEVFSYSYRDEIPALDSPPKQFMIVEKNAIIHGGDIRDAQAVSRTGSDFDYQISFTLTPDGAQRFGEWTGRNIGNYLAVVLDGKIQSTAYIKGQIFDQGEISGRFSKAAAEDIALSLKSGYLPAELKIVDERQFQK